MSNLISIILFFGLLILLLNIDAKSKRDYYICQNKVTKERLKPLNKFEYDSLLKVFGKKYLEDNICIKKVLTKEEATKVRRVINK